MKNVLFFILFIFAFDAFSQGLIIGPDVIYEYNAAGNRVKRYPVVSPGKTDGSDTVTTTPTEEQLAQLNQNKNLPLEQQEGFNIILYPNPTNGILQVAAEQGFMGLGNKLAFVYSLKGELITQQSITISNFTLDFTQQAMGYYIVRVVADGYGKEWKVQKL